MPSKKIFLLLIIILLYIPVSFSKIDITTGQDIYNLGDKIIVHASVLKEQNFEGLLNLHLTCQNKSQQIYLTPISLEGGFRTTIEVPGFKADKSIMGSCRVRAQLLENTEEIEGYDSNGFAVTDYLEVIPLEKSISTLPGDIIALDGSIKGADRNIPSNVKLHVYLNEKNYTAKIIQGDFTAIIKIPKIIKSGQHIISLIAFDDSNNHGEAIVLLEIMPVAARIEIEIDKQAVNPEGNLSILPILLDQNSDKLNKTVAIELKSPDNIQLYKKEVLPNMEFWHSVGRHDKPGVYSVNAFIDGIDASEYFIVSKIKEVKITYKDKSVIVENIGNVLYEEEIEFKIQGEKEYTVVKKVNLEPGGLATFDLTKEVEVGVYDVILERDNNSTIKTDTEANLSDTTLNDTAAKVLAEQVNLEDNRPIPKKVASGFSKITAAVVGADGLLAKNPIIAPLILIILILLGVVHYSKGKIFKIFRKNKNDKI